MKRSVYILCLLFGMMSALQAQKISNRGTDFWAGFGHHLQMEIRAWFPGDSIKLVFDFSAEQAAHVVVTIDGTTYREEYDVPANSVMTSKRMPLPPAREPGSVYDAWLYTRTSNWPGGTNSEGIFKNKGIHIVSDVPIVVFERMYFEYSSAATMLFPTDSWGYHYKCLAAPQNFVAGDGGAAGAFSYFYIIANQNNTKVRINPSVTSRSGLPANTPFDVVLQKGDIYQYLGAQKDATTMYSVTGTTITSVANSNGECLPFAAFVGSSATSASCPGNAITGSLEHLLQQIFPQQAWGKKYFTIPTSPSGSFNVRNTNTFRVMVKDPATVVTRNGVPLTGLTAYGTYEFTSNTTDVIEANLPIQVAQYLPSQVNNCGYTGNGDPDYLILSPVEQGIRKASFMRTSVDHIEYNYLALTIPDAGIASLKIDGKFNNYSQAFPHPSAPGYTVVTRMWFVRSNTDPRPPAQCTVESDSAFNAFTYGLGPAETYMYNAGTYINNLNGLPFIKNQYNTSDTANLYTCAKTPVELSVLLRYKPTKILWQLSSLGDSITPANDVTINAPVAVETIEVNNLPYYRYRLPGTYVFNRPGNYNIPVFASEPTVEQCDHTERIPYQVEVRDTLQTDFSLLYQNCKASELVQMDGRAKFNDSSLIQRWEWTFKNGATVVNASGQHVTYTFNSGTNSANLIAVDHVGCIADTSKSFTLADKPKTPAFKVTSVNNCVNSTISFAENAPEAGVQNWYWDFGNSDTTTLFTNGQTTSRVYGQHDTLTVKHMVKFSNSCYSDTAVQTVIIYANPLLSIDYPVGCLPANGVIQFNSTVSTPENQTPRTYAWNFGDAAATASNPNTSTAANPTHTYAAGNYQVQLQATTNQGCKADSTFNISLQPRPTLQYGPVLQPVCFNTSAPVSVAKASVTNSVAGFGAYYGPGTDTLGNFNPSIAGVGNKTMRYVFVSNMGCIDSIDATIWVHAVPTAAFTTAADICLDQTASFTDNSTIDNSVDASARIQTWTWNFDDGTADVVRTNNQSFNRSFNNAKAHNVSLKATSTDGCVSNVVTKPLAVHAIPVADFSLPANICMPGGQAGFANASSISENGSLTYVWTFGDGTQSTNTSPSHVYATAQSYTIGLTASSAFGCVADTSKVLDVAVFTNGPVADFTVSNLRPCENTTLNFTDQSTSANSIATWQWSFGDGTKSSSQHPSKTYSTFGNYSVSLVVTDNKGCSSSAVPASKDIKVLINPVIDAGPNITAEENATITLKATAQNASEILFSWTPAGLLSNSSSLSPSYLVTQDQVFVLTATDKDGACSATDEMKVTVLRPVSVPNAFSPNGDGINDVWNVRNLVDYVNAVVRIFDRYGREVYTTRGYSKPWDGTRNGNPMPVGTYYYIIQVKQDEPPLTGSVTIIR